MGYLTGSILKAGPAFKAGLAGVALAVAMHGPSDGQVEPSQSSSSVSCDMNKPYQAAHDALLEALGLISSSKYAEANDVLDTGLSTLGSTYRSQAVLDDTSQKLALAGDEARHGRLQTAVNIKRGVLEARLELCRAKTSAAG